jgi:hypothetical protein
MVRVHKETQKEVAYEVMEEAYNKASSNGTLLRMRGKSITLPDL